MSGPRTVRVSFRDAFAADNRGLLAPEPRVRALCRSLVGLPGVRHILPDRLSVDAAADARAAEVVAARLRSETWLVESVTVE